MEIYLDKNFIRKFWDLPQNLKEIITDFKDSFLFHAGKCTIITNYSGFEEVENDDEGFLFFEMLFENDAELSFNADLSKDGVIEYSQSGGYKIFFVEYDLENLISLRRNIGYAFIGNENFKSAWSLFQEKMIFKTIDAPFDKNDPSLFKDWSDFSHFKKVPVNSIIICDKYILSNKRNAEIKNNLLKILENLIPEDYLGTLDLLIISEKIDELSGQDELLKVKKIAGQIHSLLAKYKNIKFKICIAKNQKSFKPRDGMELHDRIIYSNYYTIESTAGFSLYINNKERITSNSNIRMYFNFQAGYMKMLDRHNQNLLKYLKKLERIEINSFKYFPDELSSGLLGMRM
jgi:hypothetical protein